MIKDEDKYKLGQALKAFWKENGKPMQVNAMHTTVTVEPKFIVGNRINPEIAKKILNVYLSQVTSDSIVKEEVVIDAKGIKIVDNGRVVMEVVNEKLVDSISNKVTEKVGHELSKRQRKTGGTYVDPKATDKYTFGEIKQALAEFLMDSEKNDSKNLLKDAVMMLMK